MAEFSKLRESVIFRYNVNEDGIPVSVKIENEQKQVSPLNNTVQLEQIPDPELDIVVLKNGVRMPQVDNEDEITDNTYYVDYSKGLIKFTKANAGKTTIINYYGKGVELISASRVYDEKSLSNNDVVKTLQEIIDIGKEYIEILGNVIATKKELEEMINISTDLKNKLDSLNQEAIQNNKNLKDTNTVATKTNEVLKQTISEAQDDINTINATGNKSLVIGASQFINNEYTWTHNMNSENLTVNMIDVPTKEPLNPDYKIVDKNNILIRNSVEHPNVKVILSASYYQGNSLFGTNVEEFADDSVGVNEKSVRLKDDNGTYQNPVTNSDSVFMADGKTKLTKKVDDISTQLEQITVSIRNVDDVEIPNLKSDITKVNERVDNISNNKTGKTIYQDYRFISTSFNNEEMKLVVMLSMDGINWDIVNKEGSYTPNTGNKTLRDPSFVKVSDWWYITYTRIDWKTGNNIGFCRTKDFIEYEELNDLTFGTYNKIWAPEFFRDYKTNNTYVIFNASDDGITFHSFIQQIWFNDNIVEKRGVHTQLQGNELSSMNTIDASIFQDNNRYYLSVKDETNKVNAIFESFDLTTGYKLIKTNLFAKHEGLQIIKIENGGFRIYMDNYEDRSIGLGFVDTYDWFNSFTPFKKIITENFVGAHNFVIDMKQVAKTEQYDKSFIIANRKTDFLVTSNTDTILPFDNISIKSDFQLSTDGKKAQVGSNGLFLVTVNVTWDSKSDSSERVIELRKNAEKSSTIINLGKYQNNNLPNVYYTQSYTTLVYCNKGDEIFVNVFQASGRECNIKALDYAPSLKILKLV